MRYLPIDFFNVFDMMPILIRPSNRKDMATIKKPKIELFNILPRYKADAIPVNIKVKKTVKRIAIPRIIELHKIDAVFIDFSFTISI